MVGLIHYLILAAILFCIGLFGVLTRRNAIGVLMGLELMFNAVNINLVAFSRYINMSNLPGGQIATLGQIFTIFIITIAAAEAVVGLALVICIYRNFRGINVDEVNLMKW